MSDATNKPSGGFTTHITPEALNAMIEMAWAALTSALPEAELPRVRGLLDIVRGADGASIRLDTHQRAVVPNLFFPGLRARPWHDPVTFPWIAPLEDAADAIREEFRALDSAAFVPYSSSYVLEDASVEMARPHGWNSFYFVSNFAPIEEHLRRCPRTAEALTGVPVAKEALFSVLDPGARLPPHADEFNFITTCHLGVVIPPGCGLRVGAETRVWQEGRCLVFDTTYEHEAWNDGPSRRAVLLLDVWHPDLTPTEIAALQMLRPGLEALFGATPQGDARYASEE
ncbi:MAG TPA: aspartyl/asparaginyl beta-hydroxylase domain-containing protein [Haliangium sp.]|nr:aspartyl/asparaginyl beta-hydroxylase domain-containing protein [Haliangium sp.]